MALESIVTIASVLLIVSVVISKAFGRFGIPGLLLFLVIGMIAGSQEFLAVELDYAGFAQTIGIIALCFILFSGGMDTLLAEVKPVIKEGFLLSSIGVLGTALLVGGFGYFVLDFRWLEAFLLGAIVSSTDAAAVFSVLRQNSLSLKAKLKPLLEFESGSNDPMAVFLTVGLVGLLLTPEATNWGLVWVFFKQMSLGAIAGILIGRLSVEFINRLDLEYDGFYPVLMVAMVGLCFGGTSYVGGNGFLAVYLMGLILGNRNFVHKASLMEFHDSLASIMQILMFLSLGLLVFPSQLLPVMAEGLLISAFLIFVGRPIVVFICLHFFGYGWREKLFVSWVGLKGAVPIVLATYPLLAGVAEASRMFHLVFFIVLTSIILQGMSIKPVARLLKLAETYRPRIRYPFQFRPHKNLKSELIELDVKPESSVVGTQVFQLGLPENSLIVLLSRLDDFFVPTGSTRLEAGDRLLIYTDKVNLKNIYGLFGGEPGDKKRGR
ncbi:MAG: potassium/proton antiporter [Bradymonadales bacterium]|nr:MAG: potassium/proton antiporter [Bradymonadales bacterium]